MCVKLFDMWVRHRALQLATTVHRATQHFSDRNAREMLKHTESVVKSLEPLQNKLMEYEKAIV